MIRQIQRHARCASRITALAGVLAYHATAFLLMPSLRRSPATRARWLGRTCRGALKAIGVSIHPTGRPVTPAVIVANHASYLDILVLAALTPAVFVAKREVRDWPVFGWFARMAGTRFIDRTRRGDVVGVAAAYAPLLAENVSVVLFLEGTSSDGREVLPFKPALLDPVIRARLAVVPAAISYDVPPGHSAETEVCWWGDMTLIPHLLNLASLPCVRAQVIWGGSLQGATDRKKLAALAWDRVRTMHRAINELGARSPKSTAAQIPSPGPLVETSP